MARASQVQLARCGASAAAGAAPQAHGQTGGALRTSPCAYLACVVALGAATHAAHGRAAATTPPPAVLGLPGGARGPSSTGSSGVKAAGGYGTPLGPVPTHGSLGRGAWPAARPAALGLSVWALPASGPPVLHSTLPLTPGGAVWSSAATATATPPRPELPRAAATTSREAWERAGRASPACEAWDGGGDALTALQLLCDEGGEPALLLPCAACAAPSSAPPGRGGAAAGSLSLELLRWAAGKWSVAQTLTTALPPRAQAAAGAAPSPVGEHCRVLCVTAAQLPGARSAVAAAPGAGGGCSGVEDCWQVGAFKHEHCCPCGTC